ncbi:hypothetical protein [Jannaschia sp. 2305UL9-9]|uniref:hypothetical protein n=1 Tax=Jannaschia sp. 2305UL9-9 TaxID=3121638 RepID=UPI0035283755
MLPILTAIAGAVAGALYVRRKNGTAFDMAQYAAVWAIIFGLLGLLALILLTRV